MSNTENAVNTVEITKYVLNRFSLYIKIKNFINVQTLLDFLFRLYRREEAQESSPKRLMCTVEI